MKRLLTGLSAVLMICLVCISCKKDDPVNFPDGITSGVWAGGNGSTGYACNVKFVVDASSGYTCDIAVSSPDGKTTDTFSGRVTYDKATGSATFTTEALGAPVGAFQFNEGGTHLALSLKSTSTDYGTYTLAPVKFPTSIAGVWGGEDKGSKVSVDFSPYAIDGGVPFALTYTPAGGVAMSVTGKYTYTATDGKAVLTVVEPDGIAPITVQYDGADHTLKAKVMGFDFSLKRTSK